MDYMKCIVTMVTAHKRCLVTDEKQNYVWFLSTVDDNIAYIHCIHRRKIYFVYADKAIFLILCTNLLCQLLFKKIEV